MGSTKKSSSAKGHSGDQSLKTKKSKNLHVSTAKRSENKTPTSTRNITPPSKVSFANTSTHAIPESEAAALPNTYYTPDGYTPSERAHQLELDLLGFDRQLLEGYRLENFSQAAFVGSAGFTRADECPHHGPILAINDSISINEQNLSPMARWIAEGHTEQCALLLLWDGSLSTHKECQCGKLLEAGMGLEIED